MWNQIICLLFPAYFCTTFLFSTACGTTAQEPDDCNWPSFHGPQRTNKSEETGLLEAWPDGGPPLLWETSGLGEGYSSVSFARGYLYTAGMVEKQTHVFAFDMNGQLVWKKPNGASWETQMSHARAYTGSRSTPTCDRDRVYHLSELGRLAAFEYHTGSEIWSMELRERFDAGIPEYGYSESVLIEGDRLYCCPAGEKAYIICLDKHTGNVIWSNNEIPGNVGFNSLVTFDHGGYHQIAGLSSNCIYGVDAETGQLLWKVDYRNSRDNNVTDPIYHDGHLFASSGYGRGSILLKLNVDGKTIIPETLWHTELMDNHHGGVVLHEGYFYGAGHNNRGWFCLDFHTGEQLWKVQGKGSLTFAEDRLYCLEERGIMTLVKATPEGYETSGTFEVPGGGKGMYWAHPVVCDGKLFIRHTDKLFAYDISAR